MKPIWPPLCALAFLVLLPLSSPFAQGYDLDWLRSYGGMGDEGGKCVVIDPSGGELWMVGYSQRSGNIKADFWIVKVNGEGRNLWAKSYGGRKWDEARAAVATEDGGLAVVGVTESKGAGRSDIWLIKLNSEGDILWE